MDVKKLYIVVKIFSIGYVISLLLYPEHFVIEKNNGYCNCSGVELKAKALPETRQGTQYELVT